MKVSVYKDGSEAAFVTFTKNPGTNDNWFQASRILNTHPWSKAQLIATSTVMDKVLPSENMYWLISEGFKYSSQPIGTRTPHAHWLVIKGNNACDMAPNVAMPAILYSKTPRATYLATHGRVFNFDSGELMRKIRNSLGPFTLGQTKQPISDDKKSLRRCRQVRAVNSDSGFHIHFHLIL